MIYNNIASINKKSFDLIGTYVIKNYRGFDDIVVTDVIYSIDENVEYIRVELYCNENEQRGFIEFDAIKYYAYLLENSIITFDEFQRLTVPQRRTPESILCDIISNTSITHHNFFSRNFSFIYMALFLASFIMFTLLWIKK